MVLSREAAARKAEAQTVNTPRMCQKWTRDMFEAPSAGDRDGDNDADAYDGWLSEPVQFRHLDRKPPRGTPVAWKGGSSGNGHRAVSVGPNAAGVYMIRSTDAAGMGRVGTVPLDWVEKQWGMTYLGWSETITGLTIPNDNPQPKPPKTSRGKWVDAAIEKLEQARGKGQRGQRIAKALRILKRIDKTK